MQDAIKNQRDIMTTERSPYSGRPVVDYLDEAYTLYDADGDKIGEIVEANPEFVVAESDGGFLGLGEHRTYYVPRTHIREDARDWYLSIDKDDIEAMGWTNAPADSQFTEAWWQRYGTEAAGQPGGMRMVRFEEDLEGQAVARQAGEVTVRKDVVEETQTIEVPVRHEEVRVERRPVMDATTAMDEAGGTAFRETEQELRVPVMAEQVEVRKVARPVEEVVVSKDTREETRHVSDTVRKERFDIDDTTARTSEVEVEERVR
jgi:uncharacterized protein (TIGR02271 family)